MLKDLNLMLKDLNYTLNFFALPLELVQASSLSLNLLILWTILGRLISKDRETVQVNSM